MNEIPELKQDYTFLKKFDSRHKVWREISGKKSSKGKEKIRSNFLLHPKQLSSDSECSSPREIFDDVMRNEPNNNLIPKKMLTEACRIIHDVGHIHVETTIGDGVTKESDVTHSTKNLNSNISMAQSKKPLKCRPSSSSTRFENFDKKFTILVERSLKLLSNIQDIMMKGIPPPDGAEDYARRMKRIQEFSARFSRIYLYPLIRQMEELSVPDKLDSTVIDQKIVHAQQIILQALQAYYNHLPSSVGKCCSDKLIALLQQAIYLCQLYELLKKDSSTENNEFINIMRTQTELLMETVNIFDKKIVEKSRKTIESLNKKRVKPHNKKMKSKLSMYAVTASFRKDAEWKKTVEALAKKKFNVKSKYKTASFKHRPPVEKPHIVSFGSKVKLFPKRSSACGFKDTPKVTPFREDDIKTMIEMESELPAPPNSGQLLNHESSIASSQQQLVRDSDRGMDEEVAEDNVKKALEVLKKFFGNSPEGQTELLEKISFRVADKEESSKEKGKKKLKDPIVTITGARNAKLICIRDDNSLIEADDYKQDKEIMTDAEIKWTSSETQTDLGQEDNRTKSGSAIKISRLPKTSRNMLQLLPKDYAINIIQYKLRYSHFHKNNPMYRKAANVHPWTLMGRISDDILDYVLQSVTRELEVNEILENLYNAEFQY